MLDQGAITVHQRVVGRAEVSVRRKREATVLDRLFQSGSAKAMLPRVHDATPEVVFLNTAGGLTGGDVLDYRLDVGAGAAAVATTQTAERVYDCAGGVARVGAEFRVGSGGRLDWLPQETIFYDGAALQRLTRVILTKDAECLALEVLAFGRQAMGERVRALNLADRREIWRDGRPVALDPLRLSSAHLVDRPGLLRGAKAMASLAFVGRGAEDAARVIAAVAVDGVEAGTSGWDGRLTLRAFAGDTMPLRRYVVAVLAQLRRRPPPRVWQA